MKLVSACLVGINCAYDGKNRTDKKLLKQFIKSTLIPVCPEQLGGLTTPRLKAEICGGTGIDVLDGRARVVDENGADVTKYFVKGAYEVLNIAKNHKVKEAILKAKSPSCGLGKIFNGTFSNKLIDGDGVTATLLQKYGISIKSNEER